MNSFRKHLYQHWMPWLFVIFLVTLTSFLLYTWSVFKEIEVLMSETPVSQPTLIFSDCFVIKKGTKLSHTLLKDRLRLLNITLQENSNLLEWKNGPLDVPNELINQRPSLANSLNKNISLKIEDEKIEDIRIEGEGADELALPPTLVAHVAGSKKSIRDYVKLDDIPTILKEAIISIEDQRFHDHFGFDPRSLARAMWVNLKQRSFAQGGSTITQQLVKNLLGSNKKTLFRKFRELILAIFIEIRYEKEIILEKYLNEVYFGQASSLEIHGVTEAAKYFFNKPLSQLSISEVALIAGVIRGPAVYSPFRNREKALQRKNAVLRKLAEQNYIAKTELAEAISEKLQFASPVQGRSFAPYYVDYVKAQVIHSLKGSLNEEEGDNLGKEGLRIYTTMDPIAQKLAEKAVRESVEEVEKRLKVSAPSRLEGALAVSEPSTGRLLALVGGRSYGESTFNRILNMKRPAGSTFKPIVYLSAFIKGKDNNGIAFTPSYLLIDEPLKLKDQGKTWSPMNYEKTFQGKITLREAFINSVNIPAIKIGLDVNSTQIIDVARKLGIQSPLQSIKSLPLGTEDLSPLEILQVYSTFANLGHFHELSSVLLVTGKEGGTLLRNNPKTYDTYDPGYFELLKDLLHGVTTQGTARSVGAWGYKKPSYGKTGTTSFYRDSWFAGFSQGYSAVSWVGFDSSSSNQTQNKITLTGASAALPVWSKFFTSFIPEDSSYEEPGYNVIEAVQIDKSRNCRTSSSIDPTQIVSEYYLPDTAPEDCPQ